MRRLRLTSKEREKQVPIFSQEYGEKQEKAWWKKYRGRKWICLFGVNCLLVCLFIFFFVNSEEKDIHPQKGRQGIFMLIEHTLFLKSQCLYQKMKFLVDTTDKVKYDIYFFVDGIKNESFIISNEIENLIMLSNVNLVWWEDEGYPSKPYPKHYGLFTAFTEEEYGKMNSNMKKGLCKLAFMEYALTTDYDYIWHMESDVVYLEKWSNFFSHVESINATMISVASGTCKENPEFWQCKNGFIEQNIEDSEIFLWPLARFKIKILKILLEQLRYVGAYHEIYAGTICNLLPEKDCIWEFFDTQFIGIYECAIQSAVYDGDLGCCEFGYWYNTTKYGFFDFRNPKPAIYHPIKCSFYEHESKEFGKKWLPKISPSTKEEDNYLM